MPFIFPGSSENLTPELIPFVEQPIEVQDKLAALSIDEPLPEVYSTDLVRLIAQSPYKLYFYWNHARDPFETLRKAFGQAAATRFRLAVRLTDVESDEETFFAAPHSRNFWFDVKPGKSYRVSVGFYAPGGRAFVRLLSTEAVATPRAGVSRTSDATPAFHAPAPEFARVLNEAGYASDALEVTLEAADEATHDETTRALASAFAGTDAPTLASDDQLAEMRSLLSALAFGETPQHLLPYLSPALAAWVGEVLKERAEALNAARLLDLLRSALSLELESDVTLDPHTLDEMRRAARFVWGASDVQMPARAPRLHVPSLSEGLATRLAKWRNATKK